MALEPNDSKILKCDEVSSHWRQGDFAKGKIGFIFGVNPAHPITDHSVEAATDGSSIYEVPVQGIAVVTQSCDIVRSCIERPYVEVSPLVEIEAESFPLVQKNRMPRYVTTPSLAPERLAIDLDRTMTIEKSVLVGLTRQSGCGTDSDARALAQALSRKRSRFAFPEDFAIFSEKLKERLVEKHDKASPEGEGLRSLREIRVTAEPNWSAPKITLTIWFMKDESDSRTVDQWQLLCEKWESLVPSQGRYGKPYINLVGIDDMSAVDYIESDSLDLDHLSG